MAASDLFSQDLVRHARQEYRIHAARIGDQAGAVRAQQGAELLKFFHAKKMASIALNVETLPRSYLTHRVVVIALTTMKSTIFAVILGMAVLATGCVDTVTGRKTGGVPFVKDKISSRYQRPMDQVYEAAKEVIRFNGTLVREGTLYGQTNVINNLVKTVEGKVNQRTVWIRVEQIESAVTDLAVQARTPSGGSDIEIAAEIDKQIALKLAR